MSDGNLDPMLLELFKAELETQCQALSDSLLQIENDPGDAAVLAELMRAAHSLKGAARISGLTPIVGVAHALEDCFVAAQEGRLEPDQTLIDLGLEVNDWFTSASALAPEELEAGLAAQETKAAELTRKLEAHLAGRPASPPESPPPAEPESTPPPAPPNEEPAAEEPYEWDADETLLDLLKSELETQVEELNTHLLTLEEQGPSHDTLSALMRGAHSVKGAGRIVGFDPMVKAAHGIEDYFDKATKQPEAPLDQQQIDRTFAFNDLLAKAAAAPLDQFQATLIELIPDFEQVASGKLPTATPSPQQQGSPEPASPGQESSASPAPSPAPESEPVKRSQPAPREEDRALKVSTEQINRIMALASEILVERNQFEPLLKGLLRLKTIKTGLSQALDQLQLMAGHDPKIREHLMAAHEQLDRGRQLLNGQIEQMESANAHGIKLANELYQETLSSRMRPFQEGMQGFPRLVRDLTRTLQKKVKYELLGAQTRVDRDVLAKLEAPLNHIIRNALDHGMETPAERQAAGKSPEGRLTIEARHRAGMLLVTIQDNGRGIDAQSIKAKVLDRSLATPEMVNAMTEGEILEFLFLPGFSTAGKVTEISGRGVGLDVVQNMVQQEGGSVRISSQVGVGTTFHLQLPVTRSVLRAMITEIAGDPYGFPLARIERVIHLPADQIRTVEGRNYFEWEGHNVGLVSAHEVLELSRGSTGADVLRAVLFSEGGQWYGVEVDRILGERDCVVRPIDARLGRIPDVSAVSMMEDGSPMWLLDIDDLIRSIDSLLSEGRLGRARHRQGVETQAQNVRQILVVDDSLTVREIERKLLERHGFQVDVAVDGMEGWNAARLGQYDLIVSDVDMPRMNGIDFIKRLRQDARLVNVPVIIVSYKDREEDRLRGMEAGASHYLTKSSFQDDSFIQAVEDLIGH